MDKKKQKILRVQIEYVRAFLIAIVTILIVTPIATDAYFQDIYEISVDGEVIGYALSEEEVEEAYKAARLMKSDETKKLVIIEKSLDINMVKGNKMKTIKEDELVRAIYEQLDGVMKSPKILAYVVNINEYTATLLEREDIIEALEKTQDQYDTEDKFLVSCKKLNKKGMCDYGIEVKCVEKVANEKNIVSNPEEKTTEETTKDSEENTDREDEKSNEEDDERRQDGVLIVDFKEKIQISQTYVEIGEISSVDDVVSQLTTARNEIDKYEVKAGDSLSAIALRHDMTLDELVNQNEGLDIESYILIGDELNVIVPKTEVSVLVDEQVTYDENYNVSTEYINDSSLYVGNDVVIQEPSEGQRIVTAVVSYNNGDEYNREIINQDIIVEAKPKIIHRGTKTVPTYMVALSNPRVTSNFGARWGRQHSGIDYGCPTGTAIFASRGGTIARAGWIGTYGYCIFIDHGDGVVTRYAHLSKILVSSGDYVKQGEKIALSGNTGNSTGPHLHFEVRVNGIAKDPRNYLD